MDEASFASFTAKIRQLVGAIPQRVLIRTQHIEQDRMWREITEADIRKTLSSGKVENVRSDDLTIFWRGRDVDGRLLELQCALMDEDGNDTLIIQDAFVVRVGTAYEPRKDDARAKREWLKNHPDYEEASANRIRRKTSVTHIRRKK